MSQLLYELGIFFNMKKEKSDDVKMKNLAVAAGLALTKGLINAALCYCSALPIEMAEILV